jgi:hypothetical protein
MMKIMMASESLIFSPILIEKELDHPNKYVRSLMVLLGSFVCFRGEILRQGKPWY